MRGYSYRLIESFWLYLPQSPHCKTKYLWIWSKCTKLIYNYLGDRSQKAKVGSSFSAYLDIIYGVPQGSILGPLLFDIDLCDLCFEDYSSDFANFADDTTPYECGPTLNEVMNNLEITTEKMFEWFSFNNLKAYASKCHLFLSPYHPVPVNVKVSTIESSNCEKFLGIYIGWCFFRMSHFVFLAYLVNQNMTTTDFKRIEATDEIFQIFWSGFNSSKWLLVICMQS